jgi:L-seryl-tRNA(Ser) seleniumtransferase
MQQSGATLIEVGTTNRTYPSDYRESINPNTAALLKIHRSNFKILGFTHETSTQELATLGHENDLLVLDDLGSGCLLETSLFGMDHEPTPTEKIKAGADLVMFSGDKLLGGPQAGIIIGKKSSIKQISNHPLARALRIDKFNLAALSATLLHYVKEEALTKIPIWQMISRDESSLFEQAQEWAKSIGPKSVVIPGKSTVGGGSLPGESLPTWLLSIPCENESSVVLRLAKKLRENKPPVIARIQDDSLLLDPRTVLPKEENSVIQAVKQVIKK